MAPYFVVHWKLSMLLLLA